LYLGRIGQIDLLPALFTSIYIPEPVLLELDMGRLFRRDTINPRDFASLIPTVRPLVDAVIAQGFRLAPDL